MALYDKNDEEEKDEGGEGGEKPDADDEDEPEAGKEGPLVPPSHKPEVLIEAALFSSSTPLGLGDLTNLTGLDERTVRKAIRALSSVYRRRDTSIEIAKVGARFTMQLRPTYANIGTKLSPRQVPVALLKTLALIAYYQPIRQSEIKTMVGDKVYEQVPELRRLGMISAIKFGQTKILVTSKSFPEYFGIGTSTREGIKRWMAEKVGVPYHKGKLDIKQFENAQEDMGPLEEEGDGEGGAEGKEGAGGEAETAGAGEGPDAAIAKLEEAKAGASETKDEIDGTLAVIGETEGKLEKEMVATEEVKEEAEPEEDVKEQESPLRHEVPPLIPAEEPVEAHGPVAAMEAMTQFVAEAAAKGKVKGGGGKVKGKAKTAPAKKGKASKK